MVEESFVAGVQFSFRVVGAIAVVGLVVALLGVRPADSAETPSATALSAWKRSS